MSFFNISPGNSWIIISLLRSLLSYITGINSMFKRTHHVALMAGLLLSAGLVQAADTQTGTLTITGQVVDTTCEISVSDASAGTYDFGDISHTAFLAAANEGDVATPKEMQFTVKNCPAATKALHVGFQFSADANVPHLLSNTGSGKGVAFELADEGDNPLVSGGEMVKDVTAVADWTSGVQIDGKVHAVRNGDDWVAGDVASQATYTLTAE
ncbi:type 1 fimbrial protein [Salmonella enterica]|nr:type 1 fimbrial protein [Salmonella enterica]EBQ5236452.1 type 1 fimbrial protein [Salmonella enterica]